MPEVHANGINIHFEIQGSGEPLILIPFLGADNGCYAFQLPEYSRNFKCYTIDPRGAGMSDKPEGAYTIELMADDVASFMDEMNMDTAHVAGVSMGAGIALQLAVKHPDKIKSLSLHGGWVETDQHLASLVNSWKIAAGSLGNVLDAMVVSVFPLCLSPELYKSNPEYIRSLYEFMVDRPEQPVHGFLSQCDAVLSHDCTEELEYVTAPTCITFGERDLITPPMVHGETMKERMDNVEMKIFKSCLHSPILEKTDEFNKYTLEFLNRNSG